MARNFFCLTFYFVNVRVFTSKRSKDFYFWLLFCRMKYVGAAVGRVLLMLCSVLWAMWMEEFDCDMAGFWDVVSDFGGAVLWSVYVEIDGICIVLLTSIFILANMELVCYGDIIIEIDSN